MPRSMGSGCAIFDADGDGRPDVFLLQNGGPDSPSTNRLFRQAEDGRFVDVSAGSGLDFAGHNMGVAVGDVDDDGRPDVLVTQYRGARLFLNRGGCRFEDVTAAAGIDNPLWGTSAAFFDYDRDGRLDLVIVNYVVVDLDPEVLTTATDGGQEFCGPNNFPGTRRPAVPQPRTGGRPARRVRGREPGLRDRQGRRPRAWGCTART